MIVEMKTGASQQEVDAVVEKAKQPVPGLAVSFRDLVAGARLGCRRQVDSQHVVLTGFQGNGCGGVPRRSRLLRTCQRDLARIRDRLVVPQAGPSR